MKYVENGVETSGCSSTKDCRAATQRWNAARLKSADTKTELLGCRLKTLTDVSPDHVTTRERPHRVGHGTRPLLDRKCVELPDRCIWPSCVTPPFLLQRLPRGMMSPLWRCSRTSDRNVPDSRLACLPWNERHSVRAPTICMVGKDLLALWKLECWEGSSNHIVENVVSGRLAWRLLTNKAVHARALTC